MTLPTPTGSPHDSDHWQSKPTLEKLSSQDIFHLRAAFMLRLFPDPATLNVVEVGSGPAHDSLVLATRGAKVTGVDFSQAGLDIGREIYESQGLSLTTQLGDARQLPFEDDTFDLSFNGGVLEHFEDDELERVIDEMARVVRPGGTVLAFCPNRYNVFYQHHLRKINRHSYEFERAFTAAELRSRFEARGLMNVQVSGVHVHPAPNYFLPTWLPKYHKIEPFCRWLFGPLERTRRFDRIKSLIGQDFVVWATVPQEKGRVRSIATFGGGPAVRVEGKAA